MSNNVMSGCINIIAYDRIKTKSVIINISQYKLHDCLTRENGLTACPGY